MWSYFLYSKQRGPRSGPTLHNEIDYCRKKIAFLHAWVYTTFAVWSAPGILNLFNSVREQWRPCLNAAFFGRAVSQVKR